MASASIGFGENPPVGCPQNSLLMMRWAHHGHRWCWFVVLYNRFSVTRAFRAFLVLVYPFARQFTLCDSLPFCTGPKVPGTTFLKILYTNLHIKVGIKKKIVSGLGARKWLSTGPPAHEETMAQKSTRITFWTNEKF